MFHRYSELLAGSPFINVENYTSKKRIFHVLAQGLILGLLFLITIGPTFAQGYESGHAALEVWDSEARANVPLWIRIWLRFMQLTFVVGIAFIWNHSEARWAVGGFIAVFAVTVLSQTLTSIVPLSGFIALLHVIFWAPALYFLITRRPFLKERTVYALWSALITIVIIFSFVFDVPSMIVYLDHISGLGMFS